MSAIDESLSPAFDWPVRVYYEDTDAGGVVFYANYLRFMERGRTEWLRAKGFEQEELRARDGLVFAVRKVTLDYLAPARLDDLLVVRTTLARQGGASLDLDQIILRQNDATLCCAGRVKVVSLEAATLRPRRLPPEVVSGILSCPAPRSGAPKE